jgi:drug/metabolite transporter (DMT)-like permease
MPYLLLILTTLFWSGNFVLSRGMHADIPPLALSFWRWLAALLILACIGAKPLLAQRRQVMRHKYFLIVQGALGVTGFNSLIYVAMQTTTAINATLVNSCIPILIVLISRLLHRERLQLRQGLGVMTSLAGVLLIISGGDLASFGMLQYNVGDLLVFLAAIIWALYSVNLRKYPLGLHPLAYQTAIVIIGLVFLLPLYLLELAAGRTMPMTPATVATIGYVALFASVLAFIFWNRAVAELGANIAGPFIHLMPVFSTILAVVFLGETLSRIHLIAIPLIFGGIFMTTLGLKAKKKA